ncbi:MAG: TonB-dependent receptor [Pelomonas sp.]|nr:TonB-dependent receptor [Roseateles sp.]
MFKRKSINAAVLLALSAGAVGVASAQDASPQQLERVTVTGSNIRRLNSETPSPVQVLTAADLKQSGFTTISEVLQNLTANGQGTLSNAFPGAFAGSATGVSLRGLTTAATLVLIDGHRMAPFPLSDDGQRSFVDVSSIPFDAVERVEILKDGASAAYGSDAMAGVVNIILKKAFTGTKISAEAGTTTEGGGRTGHASIIHGVGNLDSDGYTAYINLEARHQDRILYSKRAGRGPWASLDQTGIGGNNQTPGVINDYDKTPPTYGTVYLTALGAPFSAANSVFITTPMSPNAAYTGSCASYAMLTAGQCAYTNPNAEVQPQTTNVNVIASFTAKLAGDWQMDLKASLFESKGEQYRAGSTAQGLVTYPGSFSPLVAVSAGVNPYLVGSTIAAITVPATYPGNTLGVAAKVRGVIPDAPAAHDNFDNKSYRFVASFAGSGFGWDMNTAFGYTQVQTSANDFGSVDVPVLYAALNRATNPFKITGGNTAADLAAIFPSVTSSDVSTLEFAEFNASRPIAKLAGGDMQLALGATSVHRALDAPAPGLIAQGIVSGNNAYVLGSQTNTAVYGELSAPVLKQLELDAHVRYDMFSNAENSVTPSLGFKFTPTKEFAFRGTVGTGFRAPNAAENGKAGQAYSAGTTFDPVLCPGGNAAAAGAVISQCNFNPAYLNAANPNLKPEKSNNATLGVVVEPTKDWSTTFDLYQVRIKDQIVAGTGDINHPVRGNPVTDTCSDGHGGTVSCTTSVGPILYIPVEFVNANQTKVSGLELDTKYKLHLGEYGALTTELDWSHTTSYIFTQGGVSYQLAGTHGPAVIGGNTGNPKDRAQLTFNWEKGPLRLTTTVNYISSFSLTDPSGSNSGTPVLTCADGVNQGGYYHAWFPNAGSTPSDPGDCKVRAFTTVTLAGTYRYNANWTFHGNIDNLFNRQPPLDLNTYGGGNLPYNPSMHQAGAVGRFVNVGASYTF